MCVLEQTLNARLLTLVVRSEANNLDALTPHDFLLGKKKICLLYLQQAEEIVDHRKLFRQTGAYANTLWYRRRKEYLPTLNNRQVAIYSKRKTKKKATSFGRLI